MLRVKKLLKSLAITAHPVIKNTNQTQARPSVILVKFKIYIKYLSGDVQVTTDYNLFFKHHIVINSTRLTSDRKSSSTPFSEELCPPLAQRQAGITDNVNQSSRRP